MALFIIGAQVRLWSTGTSHEHSSLCTGTTSEGTRERSLNTDSRVWKEIYQFPLSFPIPPWGILNKMAGAELTNEGTVSPWAFKSGQYPSMLPDTIPCYWDLVWTGPGQELDLQAWDFKFVGEVWYWNVAACRYQCTRITYCTWCTPVKRLCTRDVRTLKIWRHDKPRENKATERTTRGVGWDMWISLHLFLDTAKRKCISSSKRRSVSRDEAEVFFLLSKKEVTGSSQLLSHYLGVVRLNDPKMFLYLQIMRNILSWSWSPIPPNSKS